MNLQGKPGSGICRHLSGSQTTVFTDEIEDYGLLTRHAPKLNLFRVSLFYLHVNDLIVRTIISIASNITLACDM